uniref:Uncharacterized protein n=1 Tax=Abalone asfa-like virus TaxID=2839893 RepID=A0A5K7XZ66_9VIRU|nr:hypothetical protein [Abalone asfa-like virus]
MACSCVRRGLLDQVKNTFFKNTKSGPSLNKWVPLLITHRIDGRLNFTISSLKPDTLDYVAPARINPQLYPPPYDYALIFASASSYGDVCSLKDSAGYSFLSEKEKKWADQVVSDLLCEIEQEWKKYKSKKLPNLTINKQEAYLHLDGKADPDQYVYITCLVMPIIVQETKVLCLDDKTQAFTSMIEKNIKFNGSEFAPPHICCTSMKEVKVLAPVPVLKPIISFSDIVKKSNKSTS